MARAIVIPDGPADAARRQQGLVEAETAPLPQVADHRHQQPVVVRVRGAERQLHRYAVAVPGERRQLHRAVAHDLACAGLQVAAHPFAVAFAQVFRDQQRDIRALQLLSRVAEHRERGGVHVADPGLEVSDQDGVTRGLHDGPEPRVRGRCGQPRRQLAHRAQHHEVEAGNDQDGEQEGIEQGRGPSPAHV